MTCNPCSIESPARRDPIQRDRFARLVDPLPRTSRPRCQHVDGFEKDILRVGNWRIGGQWWNVTPKVLGRLAENWRRASRLGVRIPVVWNHSADARDQIGTVASLFVRDGRLWCRFDAPSPADRSKLGVTANEVSIEVQSPWRDGLGHAYDIMVTHVAVVHGPVIAGQCPFRPISLLIQGAQSMFASSPFDPSIAGVDVAQLVASVNRVLESAQSAHRLPVDTTAETLVERLPALVADLVHEPASPVETGEVAQLRLEIDRLALDLARERQVHRQGREQVFVTRLDRIIGEGRLAPARRSILLQAGRSADFDVALLSPFEDVPPGSVFPTESLARRGATADPPAIRGRSDMSLERALHIARDLPALAAD